MTGTFHFRLDTLLRLRLADRDQRRADLAKALRAVEMLRGEERTLMQQQAEAAQRGRQLKSPGDADVESLLRTHRYEVVLIAQRRLLATQIAQ
jgi:flagellar protein FliJ